MTSLNIGSAFEGTKGLERVRKERRGVCFSSSKRSELASAASDRQADFESLGLFRDTT